MATLKLAPTLLNSFDFYMHCPENWKSRAWEGLTSAIKRKPFIPTPEIQKGLKFEDAVQKRVEGCKTFGWNLWDLPGSTEFKTVAHHCMDGKFQVWGRKSYDVPGYGEVLTQGKADVLFTAGSEKWKDGKIIDLKTTGNFKDERKYTESWQHLFYCKFWDIPYFQYIVAVWESPESEKISQVKSINMSIDLDSAEERIVEHTKLFFQWLNLNNLWDDYYHTYCKNPR